jgi:hypothetical protein
MSISRKEKLELKNRLLDLMNELSWFRKRWKRDLPYYLDRDVKRLITECAGVLVATLDHKNLGS